MKSLFLPLLGAASGGLFTTVNRVFFKSRHGKYLAAPPRAGCFVVLLVLVGLLAASVQADVVFTSLYSFTGANDGANPEAGLVQGSDGYFYGTTYGGGTNDYGTVFKISTNGALTSLYSFAGVMMAQIPRPGWCRAATAISMARLTAAARTAILASSHTAMAPCSKSAPMGR